MVLTTHGDTPVSHISRVKLEGANVEAKKEEKILQNCDSAVLSVPCGLWYKHLQEKSIGIGSLMKDEESMTSQSRKRYLIDA